MRRHPGSSGRWPALRRRAAALRLPGWAARLGLLPVLAGLLGLVLLAELRPGGNDGGALPAVPLPRGAAAMADPDVQGWTQTILARPLFNPDRRPSGVAGGNAGLPRLSAILIGRGMACAIFAADGQKPLVVQPGGLVDGDRVRSISADQVVLLTAAGLVTLRPQFAKGTAPAAAPRLSVPSVPRSPKTGQPVYSSVTAGPYDNE
jgi:hypothetical protein